MPRSFLVKKVKLDDFSSDFESSYGRSRADLSLRFHEKGKRPVCTLIFSLSYVFNVIKCKFELCTWFNQLTVNSVRVSTTDLRSHYGRRSHTSLVSVESAHFWGRDFEHWLQETQHVRVNVFFKSTACNLHPRTSVEYVGLCTHKELRCYYNVSCFFFLKHCVMELNTRAHTHRLLTHTHAHIQMSIKGPLHHVSSHYLRSR